MATYEGEAPETDSEDEEFSLSQLKVNILKIFEIREI